ncbi:tRNA pseudouridine(55) synthase TruB [Orrella marina]|uniref:tRNA pseudouridine synthase B n=1 Tax=Orrella marina TaxID=2163011 RepID=A0A2R4XFK6_9BURK|nr:tRNA pseudouridine(55) synthase TruB [Orrella marina]AWB32592.1 tRNA pseudouridine(55) synthase TruB [Orrella marina]
MRKRRGRVLDGLLLLDKPVDLSSNHALQRAKRLFDAQKAGHTGTLDPFATGLLICCFGRMTKIAGHMLEADKTYVATMQLGVETDSGDLTGEVTARHEIAPALGQEEIGQALAQFEGEIEQLPPMTSALKHKGKPLYTYARQGIEIERQPRKVTIYRIRLLDLDGSIARFEVECSKGTYIRTLAQDVGRVLGVGAHLVGLQRTRIGPFDIKDAYSLERLAALEEIDSALIGPTELPDELKGAVPMPAGSPHPV